MLRRTRCICIRCRYKAHCYSASQLLLILILILLLGRYVRTKDTMIGAFERSIPLFSQRLQHRASLREKLLLLKKTYKETLYKGALEVILHSIAMSQEWMIFASHSSNDGLSGSNFWLRYAVESSIEESGSTLWAVAIALEWRRSEQAPERG